MLVQEKTQKSHFCGLAANVRIDQIVGGDAGGLEPLKRLVDTREIGPEHGHLAQATAVVECVKMCGGSEALAVQDLEIDCGGKVNIPTIAVNNGDDARIQVAQTGVKLSRSLAQPE